MTKGPGKKVQNKTYEPYALEIGRIAYAWNHLHEALAILFSRVLGFTDASIPLAVWHSTRSDLAQRHMLRAAAHERYAHNKKAQAEIKWLLDRIDDLSNKRNDAIHAPLIFASTPQGTGFQPYDFTNNPRAIALKGKPLLDQLIWFWQTVQTLRDHARRLCKCLHPNKPSPLPNRPILPSLGSQLQAMGKHPEPARKAPERQP